MVILPGIKMEVLYETSREFWIKMQQRENLQMTSHQGLTLRICNIKNYTENLVKFSLLHPMDFSNIKNYTENLVYISFYSRCMIQRNLMQKLEMLALERNIAIEEELVNLC